MKFQKLREPIGGRRRGGRAFQLAAAIAALSPSPSIPPPSLRERTEKLEELFKREIEGGARGVLRSRQRRAAQKRRGNFSNLEARRFIRQCRIFLLRPLLRRFEKGKGERGQTLLGVTDRLEEEGERQRIGRAGKVSSSFSRELFQIECGPVSYVAGWVIPLTQIATTRRLRFLGKFPIILRRTSSQSYYF